METKSIRIASVLLGLILIFSIGLTSCQTISSSYDNFLGALDSESNTDSTDTDGTTDSTDTTDETDPSETETSGDASGDITQNITGNTITITGNHANNVTYATAKRLRSRHIKTY